MELLLNELELSLSVLLPIVIICISVSYVKVVFVKKDDTALNKWLGFLASATFGTVCGFVSSKFYSVGIQLLIAPVATILADQLTNKIDKTGLKEILDYIRRKK